MVNSIFRRILNTHNLPTKTMGDSNRKKAAMKRYLAKEEAVSEADASAASCSASEAMRREEIKRTHRMLSRAEQMKKRAIAEHYAKNAHNAIMLVQLLNSLDAMSPTKQNRTPIMHAESTIDQLIKELKASHLEDLGIELS